MPATKAPLPFKPNPDASLAELRENLGDLLAWCLGQRVGQLKAAGLTDADLMKLRRVAVNYQHDRVTFTDVRFIWEIMPMLEQVKITKSAE